MDIWQVLQAASVLIALGSVAGLALQRGIVVGLREQVGDQRTRIEFLESGRTEDKAELSRQASELTVLRPLVTGEVHWSAISDLLEHHHKATTDNWQEAHRLLENIDANTRGRP